MEGQPVPLRQRTTLRTGGVPTLYVEASTESQLIEVVADHDRAAGLLRSGDTQPADSTSDWQAVPSASESSEPGLLVLGGGSNLVVSDAPFDGTVITDSRSDLLVRPHDREGSVLIEATAGVTWDDLVSHTVTQGWSGLEALSGIPGTVGAAPIQNIGAYGREVGDNLVSIRAYDRLTGEVVSLPRRDLALGYRDSVLKRSLHDERPGGGRTWKNTGRWVVLSVLLELDEDGLSAPVRYGELARTIGVEVGERAPGSEVRSAVLELRRSKGMVLDPSDHDTWSAGSFFTNPILSQRYADEVLPFKAPRFPVEDAGRDPLEGKVKTSAAWLISQTGFEKGFGLTPGAQARLSSKHVLAITNRGAATSDDVVALARAVRDGVEEHFGIRLEPEPVQVGLTI